MQEFGREARIKEARVELRAVVERTFDDAGSIQMDAAATAWLEALLEATAVRIEARIISPQQAITAIATLLRAALAGERPVNVATFVAALATCWAAGDYTFPPELLGRTTLRGDAVAGPDTATGAESPEAPGTPISPSAEGLSRQLPGTSGTAASATSTTAADGLDDVWCSVFCPPAVAAGQQLFVQVFAHLRGEATQVEALAKEFDAAASRRAAKRLKHPVRRGTELMFLLVMPGATVTTHTERLVWRGEMDSLQFVVDVPDRAAQRRMLVGTIYVIYDSIPFGHVRFQVQVNADSAPLVESDTLTANAFQRYRHAFISYASPDRAEVLKRVQMLPRVAIEYFQDLLTLEPGDRWCRELYRYIDKSDVFFLFWSSHAKNSLWVMKEVEYALLRKGADEEAPPEIVPVIIEGPPPVPPPPSLQHLHFNDRFIYFIQSTSA